MSLFDRVKGRPAANGLPDGMVPADKLAAQARREASTAPAPPPPPPDLVAQRDRIVERFTALQAELGGVFYEMAIRDHVRMDVLTMKAAELQRVDAELAAVERALRGDDGPATGTCPSCGSPRGADARFCSRCGFALPGGADAPPDAPPTAPAPAVNGSGEAPA